MPSRLRRFIAPFLALFALLSSTAAVAEVQIHFHSFNGSVLSGRYPHTFIVLEGTLEADGRAVNENYGFTAKSVMAAATRDWADHLVEAEEEKYVRSTNRHFSITLTDEQYFAIVREVRKWENEPGKRYSLDERNCIHFVGAMAAMLGVKIEYPKNMLRRPKKWLNHITTINPQLGASVIK